MARRSQAVMWRTLFARQSRTDPTLQGRLRTMVVRAILDGLLTPGTVLPSSRQMAQVLAVSRNTVTLAYQHLADQGYLQALPRSGYVVSALEIRVAAHARHASSPKADGPQWQRLIERSPSTLRNIRKPADWQHYRYPFLYAQFDPTLFPAREWRECSIHALRATAVRDWASDRIDQDDPVLIEQIQQRVLPARGIWASRDEILITVGAQQANYILAELLVGKHTVLGLEDPGYPDVRNIFSMRGAHIEALPVGAYGLRITPAFARCDFVYVTPSHQCPTTVTMPQAQRQQLLDAAVRDDVVIIEDDYDSELNFAGQPNAAIKSIDRSGRVIYVGSLSKTIAPGLRAGFMVADAALIREARAARRLMMRHPPTNNERALALFLALGHHDALVRRLTRAYAARLAALADALGEHLPDWKFSRPTGGSALWVKAPPGHDVEVIATHARAAGVLLEPGRIFFSEPGGSGTGRHARFGISAISEAAIAEGIAALAQVVRTQPVR